MVGLANISSDSSHEALFKAVNSVAIIAMTDIHGVITWANENFCRISGYLENELIGKNHRVLNSGHHPSSFFEDMWKTIQSGQVWRGLICNRSKSGQLYWVSSSICPIRDSEGGAIKGYVSVRLDVTEQILSQRQLVEKEKQIQVAAKLATIGELAATIAHEINNPLAVLRSSISHIHREIEKKEKLDQQLVEKRIDASQRMVDRIGRIIGSLRRMARDSSKDPFHKTALTTILNDTFELIDRHIKMSGVDICIEPKDLSSHYICCRPSEMVQVFSNLIKNSIDAVSGTGQGWIRIVLNQEDCMRIQVIDSGLGIPEEVRSHIFDPMFTTKPEDKGNGLGLPIVKKIIENHGGSIAIKQNHPNTCFEILLPLNWDEH